MAETTNAAETAKATADHSAEKEPYYTLHVSAALGKVCGHVCPFGHFLLDSPSV